MPHPDAIEPVVVRETAFAKINLALHVRRRRADGFHELETLFAFAEDGDALDASALSDGELRLELSGPFADALAGESDNLVLRAARALRSAHGNESQGAIIRLTKNLPIASGIGGGSADAAAALRLLAVLWRIDATEADLIAIADGLGSDVPACVVSRTLLGTGRGEALDPIDWPELAGTSLLLVNPGIGLSTAAVFKQWDGQDRGALRVVSRTDLDGSRNDLEPPARAVVPEIGHVLDWLEAQPGASFVRMSGSGATCFALFDEARNCAIALEAVRVSHPSWWAMASSIRS